MCQIDAYIKSICLNWNSGVNMSDVATLIDHAYNKLLPNIDIKVYQL